MLSFFYLLFLILKFFLRSLWKFSLESLYVIVQMQSSSSYMPVKGGFYMLNLLLLENKEILIYITNYFNLIKK